MASKPKAAEQGQDVPEQEDGEGAPAPARKFSLKLILIAVAGLIVVGGGGYFAYSKFFGHGKDAQAEKPVAKPAVFVDVPEILVNLSNAGSDRTQYLRVKMTLELPDQALTQQLQPLMPRVTDTFQTYLRELRPSDLDGSAGLYRLKEELTRRINLLISPNHVNAVLFKEIVVQ